MKFPVMISKHFSFPFQGIDVGFWRQRLCSGLWCLVSLKLSYIWVPFNNSIRSGPLSSSSYSYHMITQFYSCNSHCSIYERNSQFIFLKKPLLIFLLRKYIHIFFPIQSSYWFSTVHAHLSISNQILNTSSSFFEWQLFWKRF